MYWSDLCDGIFKVCPCVCFVVDVGTGFTLVLPYFVLQYTLVDVDAVARLEPNK
jgi:hypothetical protein